MKFWVLSSAFVFFTIFFLNPFTSAYSAKQTTLTELTGLGGRSTTAVKINNNGIVVGYGQTPDFKTHALLWSSSSATMLPSFPNSSYSVARGINDFGAIVGTDQTSSGKNHAVLWENGVEQDLGTLGGNDSSALSINNRGQIVGTSKTVDNVDHAFLWENGSMKDLGAIINRSGAWVINDRGTVAGFSDITADETEVHGVIFSNNNTFIDVGTLGGARSEIRGGNNKDQFVGFSSNSASHTHAILFENNILTDLGALPSTMDLSVAEAINEKGIIVGASYDSNGLVVPVVWENNTIKKLDLTINPFNAHTVASDINSRDQIVIYQLDSSGGKSYLLQY